MFPGANNYDNVDWGNPISSHPLNRGLVAWFLAVPCRFRVGSLQWQDLTRVHTATLTNTPVWGKTPERPGGRMSLNFNGTTAYAAATSTTRLNLSETASSVAFWVRCPYATADFCAWLDKGTGDAASSHAWYIQPNTGSSDGRLAVLLEDSLATSASNVFLDSIWCHIVVTWDGSNVRFYRNGAFIESQTQPVGTYRSTNTSSFNMGALLATGPFPIARVGTRLDDVRLYDSRVLGAGEVTELYRLSCQSQGALLNRWRSPRCTQQDAAAATRAQMIGGGIGSYIVGA